jgi:GNAT superfamily N-acetyltransferase
LPCLARQYHGEVLALTIDDESIATSGALSVVHAADDELKRRYGGGGDDGHLHVDELAEPLGLFLVARVQGDIAGGIGLRSIGDPAEHLGEIKRLWVRPDLRRGGVAVSLMNEIESRARSLGYVRLYLETGPKQPEAVALYSRIGWDRVQDYPADVFCHPMSHRFTKAL